jgi:hypothetical protein
LPSETILAVAILTPAWDVRLAGGEPERRVVAVRALVRRAGTCELLRAEVWQVHEGHGRYGALTVQTESPHLDQQLGRSPAPCELASRFTR